MEPRVVPFLGDDPLAFVISKNLHRRHLNESQRAMVAAKLAKIGRGRPGINGVNSPHLTTADAADKLNVSSETVKDAKAVQSKGVPDLVKAVESGDVSVSAAAEIAKLPEAEQKEVVAQGPAAVKKKAAAKRKANQHAEVGRIPPYLPEAKPPIRQICRIAKRLSRRPLTF